MSSNLLEEYETYTKKYQKEYGPKTIVLYRCGSFYEIYSCNDELINIKEISEMLGIQVSRRSKAIIEVNRNNFNMAGFPMYSLKKFVNILLSFLYTVVIVDQVSEAPKPKREVTDIISPGTKIEDVSPNDSNLLLVAVFEEHELWRNKKELTLVIGISLIDLSTGKSKISEYSKNSLDELYKTISFFNPKEIVFTSIQPIQYTFDDLKSYLELSTTCVHDKLGLYPDVMTKISYQEQLLKKIYPKYGLLSIFEYLDIDRMPVATQSFVYILEFCQKHNCNITKGLSAPDIVFVQNTTLLLSYNTCNKLGIHSSLIPLLNNCQTSIGRRSFRDRILTPLTDPDAIVKSYDKVEEYIALYKETSAYLQNIYDLERLYRKMILKKLHPADFVQIDQTIEAVYNLKYTDATDKLDKFVDEFRSTLNMQEIQKYHLDNIKTSFFIPGKFSDIDKLQQRLEKLTTFFETLAKNITLCKVESNERDGFYISITSKRFSDIKKEFHNKVFTIDEFTIAFKDLVAKPISSSSPLLRLTDFNIMKKINNEIEEIIYDLKELVLTKYQDFVEKMLIEYQDIFAPIIKFIGDVDWYTSCAINATKYRYSRPILSNRYDDKSYIDAVQIRHPIIENIMSTSSRIEYVPNDIQLGIPQQNGILLYGINSSGKSSISKAVAINIMMAQAGMYVPCEKMEYWPYQEIFTRIPSGDDMLKGQSTFIVEITELRNILKRCTPYSLVIGDEVASGTESVSALAIVSAGILQLEKKQSSFIFASHLHDLCNIDQIKNLSNVGVYHLSVRYDTETQKLIYDRKLTKGQGNTLYGLEVCKSLSLGDEFMSIANTIRQEVLNSSQKSLHVSKYNSNLFVDLCSICKKPAKEVHHIKHQASADKDGYIKHIHKNILSNLAAVCESCHDKIHNNEIIIEGYRQTSDNIELSVINVPPLKTDYEEQCVKMKKEGCTHKYISTELKISIYKVRKILSYKSF